MLAMLTTSEGSREAVASALKAELGAHAQVMQVRETPDCRVELRRLNAERDLLLKARAFVIFLSTSGAEARFLKQHCKDLTATVDLLADVGLSVGDSWEELSDALRRVFAEKHQFIDLTGLVPHSGEPVRLPMEQVYLAEGGLTDLVRSRFPDSSPLLVLAPPGAGKSTTLRYVCWRAASRGQVDGAVEDRPLVSRDRLAVYLPLAAWYAAAQDRALPLGEFLGRYLGGLLQREPLELHPHHSRLVLLLDGLDEVPSTEARRELLTQAAAMARDGAQVLVMARDLVADDLRRLELNTWTLGRLRDLPASEGLELVERILKARHDPEDPKVQERVVALRTRIVMDRELLAFARRPLLLTFLVILADLGRELPTHRTELYRDLVEMLITSWRRLRTDTRGGHTLRRADILRVLAPLGWQLVVRGVGGLSRQELLALLTELEGEREPDPVVAHEVAEQRLRQLEGDTALLRTDGLWRFNHPTLAEYLAARAVLQDARVRQEVCADPYRPELTQVVAFATALSTDIEPRDDVVIELADALEQRARRRGRYDSKIPRLVAAVVEEARGLPAHRRGNLIEHALRVSLERALSPGAMGEALSALEQLLGHRDLPGVRAVASAWLVPPKSSIRWEAIADYAWGLGTNRAPLDDGVLIFRLYQADLSLSLVNLELDPRPLLRTMATHADHRVRSMFWGALLGARATAIAQLVERDPEVSTFLLGTEVSGSWWFEQLQYLARGLMPTLPAREAIVAELPVVVVPPPSR
ncbi:MAG: hypothetical protein H6740_14565 [Alphaproteobacteria bacterium]|nr:hypothetical protein [Alphaproteobacteria bacterium]